MELATGVLMVALAIVFGVLLCAVLFAQRLKRMTEHEWREFVDGCERVRRELGGRDVHP